MFWKKKIRCHSAVGRSLNFFPSRSPVFGGFVKEKKTIFLLRNQKRTRRGKPGMNNLISLIAQIAIRFDPFSRCLSALGDLLRAAIVFIILCAERARTRPINFN